MKFTFKWIRLLLLSALWSSIFVGCIGDKYKINIQADDNLNGGHTTDIFIMQMRSKEGCEKIEFSTIRSKQFVSLDDLINTKEMVVFPKSKKTISLEKHPETTDLCVAGIFRNYNQDGSWKQNLKLKRWALGEQKLILRLNENTISFLNANEEEKKKKESRAKEKRKAKHKADPLDELVFDKQNKSSKHVK